MNTYQTFQIDLGPRTIGLPVFDTGPANAGKTVVITAGMDGDEYAGIEAAKLLIRELGQTKVNGRIVILPLVNIPGYEIAHSRNPLDGLFPKNIYPGKPGGKPSERLIWWIHENYLKYADVWLDLHGGATLEEMTPCVLAYESENSQTNILIRSILSALVAQNLVLCQPGSWIKADAIEKNIAYLVWETGDRGRRQKYNINQQIGWVKQTLATLNIIDNVKIIRQKQIQVYRRLQSIFAPGFGLWKPQAKIGQLVKKGDLIAKLNCHCEPNLPDEREALPAGRQESLVISPVDGILLWQTIESMVTRGDELAAIAYNLTSFPI